MNYSFEDFYAAIPFVSCFFKLFHFWLFSRKNPFVMFQSVSKCFRFHQLSSRSFRETPLEKGSRRNGFSQFFPKECWYLSFTAFKVFEKGPALGDPSLALFFACGQTLEK